MIVFLTVFYVMSNKVRSIAKNTFLVFFARGLNAVFGFTTTIVLARYLAIEVYGKFAFVYTLISFTVLLADLGSFQIITRELSRNREKAQGIINSAFIVRIFTSVLILSLIALLVHFLITDPSIKMAVYIVTVPQLFFAFNTIFVAVFAADNRFGFDALMQIISRGLEFVAIIFVVYFKLGFMALFIGIAASYGINALFGLIIYVKNYRLPTFRYDFHYGKYFLYESLPIAITTFLSIAILRVDVFVLKALKGPVDVALFNIPYVFIYTLIIIPQSFVSVIFPILCKLGNAEERNRFIFGYQKAFKFLYIVSLPISVMLTCFSNEILQFTYGEKFLTSALSLKIMGLSVVFLFLCTLNTFSLISLQKQRLGTISTAFAFFLNLMLDLVLIPKYGYIGASIATSVSYCGYCILSWYFILQNLGRLNFVPTLIKPAFGAGIMALLIIYLHTMSPFIIFPISIIVYIASLFMSRVFPFEDIELIKSLLLPNKAKHIGS